MTRGLLISGGEIITSTATYRADVLIEAGRISAIGQALDSRGVETIDADGLLVLPGVIDPHTHFTWPGAADDFTSGTIAAACGGVTSVIEYVA